MIEDVNCAGAQIKRTYDYSVSLKSILRSSE